MSENKTQSRPDRMDADVDVVVIGGGQSGLAVGYYLRRTKLDYVILDSEEGPGGAWRHGWDSLRLFSPARWSSLPGWIMPGGPDHYPSRDEFLDYIEKYEEHYNLPIRRPVLVREVRRLDGKLAVETDRGRWTARAVVSATGSWRTPYIPSYPGRDQFQNCQIHSACYQSPEPFTGKQVLIVGGGNSGAQILAEVSKVADTTWVTRREPRLLPDDVDGRTLFEWATMRYKARMAGDDEAAAAVPKGGLGDIVMVPPVREARDRNALGTVRPFERFTERGVVWNDGTWTQIDTVIWCTGFEPVLGHLEPLDIREPDGRIEVEETRSIREPRLYLVGYGEWTGYASATIIGVGRTARWTAQAIDADLKPGDIELELGKE